MTLPDLGAWLKRHSSAGDSLTLERAAALAVHEELQRLRQSNDRMRKQNAKLRRRVAKLKAGEPDPDSGRGGEE